jgi:cytochrome c oxidase subunit 3
MGSLNPVITEQKIKIGGGPPPVDQHDGGDGGDRNGDFGGRLRRYRLGLAVGLAPVLMLFVSFTSAYIVRQGLGDQDPNTGVMVRDWVPLRLPYQLLLANTFILVLSGVTMEMARREAAQEALLEPVTSLPGIKRERTAQAPWLGLTIILGIAFLAGQWLAWQELGRRGFFIASNPSSSFFYLLTGAHAVHLIGGVLALMYAGAMLLRSYPAVRRRLAVDITAWYWHFMGVLWVYIFALMYFAR